MAGPMIGINSEAFDDLILKFYDVKEELNLTFNNLNSLIDSLGDNYQSDTGKSLVESFNNFANTNFPSVLENIDSYIRDLKTAKENTNLFDTKLSAQILEEKSLM